ncbi:SWIM zinc finger family protein [sulfur-oxidizing endosymbiont of Gigantopelta aegis]|uniref:SWIM zinc finger family protein n=1 Tax=sulfur-oxidizing endosymbiont of Gigantopelta aegis TaxID=2794934 RepID=UPI001BE4BBDE|nr:SWIM zinc finger family protein [sulfur-oxidizing endosymbiont of Gigantopelta aegis]
MLIKPRLNEENTMSYYGYAPYVPVAKRKEKAKKEMRKLAKKGIEIQPITIQGRIISKSFWGKAWCEHLEQYSDFSNRLPRGQTYARNGSVCHLSIEQGLINAYVYGSELYKIIIKISPLDKSKWLDIQTECAGQIDSLLALLQGKISDSVMQVVTDPKKGLFPLSNEIKMHCDCPDGAYLCKHIAAVIYGVGHRLDTAPESLFLLRKVDQNKLISKIKLPISDKPKKRQLKGELSDIFGIDLGDENSINIVERPIKKQTTRKPISKTKQKIRKRTIRPTGKSISRLRNKFAMNISQFARLIGVSNTTIANWEKRDERLILKEKHYEALLLVTDLDKEQAWEKLE